jgi:SRSO17 transposase
VESLTRTPAARPRNSRLWGSVAAGRSRRGKHTAHVGKQWLSNIGKTENGVVSVSSLWADEGVYYPLEVEPYTPKHHFEKGKSDPRFRTKLKIARQLVERSIAMGVPFRAVVADSFYGEDEDFKQVLDSLGLGYVLALKEPHSWWHKEGRVGALWEAAKAAGWKNAEDPGQWRRVIRWASLEKKDCGGAGTRRVAKSRLKGDGSPIARYPLAGVRGRDGNEHLAFSCVWVV